MSADRLNRAEETNEYGVIDDLFYAAGAKPWAFAGNYDSHTIADWLSVEIALTSRLLRKTPLKIEAGIFEARRLIAYHRSVPAISEQNIVWRERDLNHGVSQVDLERIVARMVQAGGKNAARTVAQFFAGPEGFMTRPENLRTVERKRGEALQRAYERYESGH
ncbi:hypothetical protein [Amycolatopsis sp. WQ 127309]|uniref:hypothetical protein n=1 Tax=Amycolatopsis sp. WQ 127309 TaxID=2932773 RepID=UPI001FF62B5C|nr:hypothetical protein [Amycolatopsis sp. WQ 127309]UOZ06895.1 hypothetical protein MUY22_00960 [Amycolatopsis sp. WQ 127309]